MVCRPTMDETNPHVLATFQDFVRNNVDTVNDDAIDCGALWSLFHQQYHVEDWGISRAAFGDFICDLGIKRCMSCGTNEFPYYMAGDKECLRCLT